MSLPTPERRSTARQNERRSVTVAFMGVNNPTPAISGNGAAVTPADACGAQLVSDDLPVFHGITSIFITG